MSLSRPRGGRRSAMPAVSVFVAVLTATACTPTDEAAAPDAAAGATDAAPAVTDAAGAPDEGLQDAEVPGADAALADAAPADAALADAALADAALADAAPPGPCQWRIVQTLENPGGGAAFGAAVALAGDRLVVGGTGENGRGEVRIYTRAGGAFEASQTIVPAEPADQSFFGTSLALSGAQLVIGAAQQGHGKVFTYTRSGEAFVPGASLEAGEDAAFSFGAGLAFAGERLFVTAPEYNAHGLGEGALYAFEQADGVYTAAGQVAAGGGGNIRLGRSLGGSADAAAYGDFASVSVVPMTPPGAAPVRVSDPSRALAIPTEDFGAAVAFVATDLLASAPGERGADLPGAVFVFERGADGAYAPVGALHGTDSAPDDAFGTALASDTQTLLVGSRPALGPAGRNAVHLFRKVDAAYTVLARVEGPAGSASFGRALAIDGEVAAVSDPDFGSFGPGGGAVHIIACAPPE